jgi:hypothetical protein
VNPLSAQSFLIGEILVGLFTIVVGASGIQDKTALHAVMCERGVVDNFSYLFALSGPPLTVIAIGHAIIGRQSRSWVAGLNVERAVCTLRGLACVVCGLTWLYCLRVVTENMDNFVTVLPVSANAPIMIAFCAISFYFVWRSRYRLRGIKPVRM